MSDLDAPALVARYDGPTAAIDHNLYVRGNLVYESNYRSGLRVIDASVIPVLTRANTNLTTAAIAEKLAETI